MSDNDLKLLRFVEQNKFMICIRPKSINISQIQSCDSFLNSVQGHMEQDLESLVDSLASSLPH